MCRIAEDANAHAPACLVTFSPIIRFRLDKLEANDWLLIWWAVSEWSLRAHTARDRQTDSQGGRQRDGEMEREVINND